MMTKIYDLAYEINGDTINLEQDMGCGEVSRIDLHPIHLRLLAEEVGILAPSSNIEADRTIARLCRQMRILFDRINQLDDWIRQAAEKGHEDLEMETTYSFATWELAHEFIADLPIADAAAKAKTPEHGGLPIGNGPKSEGVSISNGPENGGVVAAGAGVARHGAQGALALEGQQ